MTALSGLVPLGEEHQHFGPAGALMFDLRVWSASLPLEWVPDRHMTSGDWLALGYARIVEDCRPWNGRTLTQEELHRCSAAFAMEYGRSGSLGLAAQAAYEFLSEHCP